MDNQFIGSRHMNHQQPTSPQRLELNQLRTSGNLRSGFNSGDTINNEEEEYNRRRQEELRKVTSSLRSKQSTNEQQQLSKSYLSFSQSSGNHFSLNRPERDQQPPSTHFTLGPAKVESNYTSADNPPPHVKEHLANLQSDNSSLMRRLNLVIQELERVQKEKDDLQDRLKRTTKESTDVHRLINSQDNVDKVNRYMQDDLAYEKDRNLKIKQQIKELDLYKSELIRELRKIQDHQDSMVTENQDLSYQLQQKLGQIEALEKEHYFTQEKIKSINYNIDNIKTDLGEKDIDKGELQRILSQLHGERNDLLNRLDHLTRKYDECVREISTDRAEMEAHNRQHAKLITAKIIFQLLSTMQRERLQASFSEFQQYCKFDNKCHQKLSQFSKILDRVGKYRMGKGLKSWFVKSLKPLGTKEQSWELAKQVNDTGLKSQFFYVWRQQYNQRMNQYDNKTRSLQSIWNYLHKENEVEKKRAFQIWKETLQSFRVKKSKVKKLLWKLYFQQISVAFNMWGNHSSNVEAQVRLNLLSTKFSQKQYLTLLFNSFRYQATEKKRKRHNILFHCVKGWKDYIQYQKFIMASNLLSMQFKVENNTNIVKHCFDALRQNKETEKFILTHHILNNEELPKIAELEDHNVNFQNYRSEKAKYQACEAVKKMMAKQLYSYFRHWVNVNNNYKERLQTKVKDKVIQLYMETIRKAFNFWKVNHDFGKIKQHHMTIQDMQQEQNMLQNDVLELSKQNKGTQEQRDCQQSKHVLKCVESYHRRMKQLAIGRWRDRIVNMNMKEDASSLIIKKMRKRFLRQAFDLYYSGFKYRKQNEINEQRRQYYIRARGERMVKQVYNNWLIYKNNHIRAKKYWYRVFLRVDINMKQQAVKRWRKMAQKRGERILEDKQTNQVEQVDDFNHEIGQLHSNETQQQMEIKSQKGQMTQQARRILSNAFARFYYVNETRGIEKWKEFVAFQKHKESLLKKFVNHWRKHQFYYVKSAFKNWILNSNISEKKEQLKKAEMILTDAGVQLNMQNNHFEATKLKLSKEIEEYKKMQQLYNVRLQKSVQMIVGKVDNNHHMSYKRYILQQWRQYVKREVQFIKSVQNVIQKSLWNKGFKEIRNQAYQKNKENNKEVILNLFRLKFWKRTCGNAFSVWRSGKFNLITTTIEETEQVTEMITQDHQSKKDKIKEHNANRSGRIISKQYLRNLYQSWKNVIQFMKFQNAKDDFCKNEIIYHQKKFALIKWQKRKEAAKIAKLRQKRLRVKVNRIKLRFFFQAMANQYYITKSFLQRLSNLANIHDQQAVKLGFNAIHSFNRAKSFVHDKRKEDSSQNLYSSLLHLLTNRKLRYLNDLKLRCLTKKKIDQSKLIAVLGKVGNKMRHYFNFWKRETSMQNLVVEMHDEGPIRGEAFEEQIMLQNYKKFLKSEGYGDSEINKALLNGKQKSKDLIQKAVNRMQHYNDDLYVKPKAFDRWKQYIQLRKLFKYWLNYTDKKSQFVECDKKWAFDKWRKFYDNQFNTLTKCKKKDLEERLLKNNNVLGNIAEQVHEKENILDNLDNQREALVETYIKGQKLAFALCQSYKRHAMQQALSRWFNTSKQTKNIEALQTLQDNMQNLENLKARIKQFEIDNETLANENEELRQFSLDGYEIAKNVQTLTNEREKLSVDLADKAQMIRKLLEENEKLTGKLRQAQDEAQHMLRSTMVGSSSGFKTAAKNYASPIMRNSNY